MPTKNEIFTFYAFLIIVLAAGFYHKKPLKDTTEINNAGAGLVAGVVISGILWELWGKKNVSPDTPV